MLSLVAAHRLRRRRLAVPAAASSASAAWSSRADRSHGSTRCRSWLAFLVCRRRRACWSRPGAAAARALPRARHAGLRGGHGQPGVRRPSLRLRRLGGSLADRPARRCSPSRARHDDGRRGRLRGHRPGRAGDPARQVRPDPARHPRQPGRLRDPRLQHHDRARRRLRRQRRARRRRRRASTPACASRSAPTTSPSSRACRSCCSPPSAADLASPARCVGGLFYGLLPVINEQYPTRRRRWPTSCLLGGILLLGGNPNGLVSLLFGLGRRLRATVAATRVRVPSRGRGAAAARDAEEVRRWLCLRSRTSSSASAASSRSTAPASTVEEGTRRRADGAQRRRQDDAVQRHHRAAGPDARAGCASTARDVTECARASARWRGSAAPSSGSRSSARCRSATTSGSPRRCAGSTAPEPDPRRAARPGRPARRSPTRPADAVPTGIARLTELARALACDPRLLLLDEPSSGLNEDETEDFAVLVRSLAEDDGRSVLIVEHDVELVLGLCSTIHVLDFGTIIASGTPAEIQADTAGAGRLPRRRHRGRGRSRRCSA